MMVHFIDGTYELFRHYYGRRRFEKGKPAPFGGRDWGAPYGAGDD